MLLYSLILALLSKLRLLKGATTRELAAEGLHPFQNDPYSNGTLPSPWTRHSWAPFLGTPQAIQRSIGYVERNPIDQGFKKQNWSFVQAHRMLEKV